MEDIKLAMAPDAAAAVVSRVLYGIAFIELLHLVPFEE